MNGPLDPSMQALARQASALMAWMCVTSGQQAHERGLRHVLFMTREGAFFKAYFERFSAVAGLDIEPELLHVSRLSTFAASLHGQGPEGLRRLFSQYTQAGWPQLLSSLGGNVMPPKGLQPEATGAALAHAIAAEPLLCAWLAGVAQQRHGELQAYMQHNHQAALSHRGVLVVDVGWRGTIQDNLAWSFPANVWHGVYVGLYPFLNAQPANSTKQALLFGPEAPGAFEGAHLLPFEYLFQPPMGSVTGYRDGLPTLAAAPLAGALAERFQQAVLHDAPRRAQQSREHTAQALLQAWHDEAVAFWEGCQQMPTALFLALKQHEHDEAFGEGHILNLSRATSPVAALRGLMSKRERERFLHFVVSLPLELRHETEVGWWLRGWLHARRFRQWGGKLLASRRPGS